MSILKVEEHAGVLKIQIKSPKKIGALILTAIMSIVLFLSICVSFFIPLNDLATILIFALVIGSFSCLLFLYLNTFFFLFRGYEELGISHTENSFTFSRMGLTRFDKKTLSMQEVKYIGLISNNQLPYKDPNSSSSTPFGYAGGPLVFIYKTKKAVEFGVALSDLEAKNVEHKLNTFLSNPR